MKKTIIGVVSIGVVLFLSGCGEDTYNAFPNQPTSVVQMTNNEKVVGWIDYKKDTDKDKVPDYLDKCPNTPKGAKVDKNGCAIDSDHDKVIDLFDKCPNTPKGAKVDKNGCAIDSDGDKIIDLFDKCPNTPKGVKVDFKGCPIDSDKDGVPNYLDKCPNTPRGVKVDFKGCPILKIFRFNFKFDSYKIDKKYYPEIKKIANIIKNNKKLKIEIEGFTDEIGTYEYNQKLSVRRANALREILIHKFKINPKKIDMAGYGENYPIASNQTKEGRRLNRRVVVIDKSKYINCIVK